MNTRRRQEDTFPRSYSSSNAAVAVDSDRYSYASGPPRERESASSRYSRDDRWRDETDPQLATRSGGRYGRRGTRDRSSAGSNEYGYSADRDTGRFPLAPSSDVRRESVSSVDRHEGYGPRKHRSRIHLYGLDQAEGEEGSDSAVSAAGSESLTLSAGDPRTATPPRSATPRRAAPLRKAARWAQRLIARVVALDVWLLSRLNRRRLCYILPVLLLALALILGIYAVRNLDITIEESVGAENTPKTGEYVAMDTKTNEPYYSEDVASNVDTETSTSGSGDKAARQETNTADSAITQMLEAQIERIKEKEERVESLNHLFEQQSSMLKELKERLDQERDKLQDVTTRLETIMANIVASDNASRESIGKQSDLLLNIQGRLERLEDAKIQDGTQVVDETLVASIVARGIREHALRTRQEIAGAAESAAAAAVDDLIRQHSELLETQAEPEKELPEEMDVAPPTEETSQPDLPTILTKQDIEALIADSLLTYDADKVGMADFALETSGGSVVFARCSDTYPSRNTVMSLYDIPLWYVSNSPTTVIQPGVLPGECWAFPGSRGHLVIRLAVNIIPTAFTLEHIPKSLSPTASIDSAPKEFAVWGLDDENDTRGALVGNFTYRLPGPSRQEFHVIQDPGRSFPVVEFKVLSNHGNPSHTCIYRFRVHGVHPVT